MHKRNTVIVSGLALVGAILSPVAAADVYVIANASVTLSAEDIRDVYLGDKQIAGAIKLVPLDNAVAQKDFLDRALKIDAAKYNSIWIKKGFRDGLNTPALKSGDAEVLAAVKANPGAIGYVSSAPKDVKVIGKY